MKTLRLSIREADANESHPAIQKAAEILKSGGLVAIPTETVYGLAANALDAAAVARIFDAKQRPAWDPLIVHVDSPQMLPQVAASVPERVRQLAVRFWPGPLTLLLPRAEQLPMSITAGRSAVAVRIPAHAVANAVIRACGFPLAAPSANLFGRTSPTSAEHVLRDLAGRIDAVLDAGETRVGVESTVLDVMRDPPLLLRPGGISREQLAEVLGEIEIYNPPEGQPPQSLASPGLAARHYAPEAKLRLVEGSKSIFEEELRTQVRETKDVGSYVGALAPESWITEELIAGGGLVLFDWGPWGDWEALAHRLFAGIRYLDKPGVAIIVCPLPPAEGLGHALRDRLLKAAS